MDKGLCTDCRHRRYVEGPRSLFLRCARASTDADYPRYPILPKLSCRGYEAESSGADEGPEEPGPD